MTENYDAIIIGSGSNGIAAAVHLQKKGLKTAIFEQASIAGGATKTEEVTLPGFKHDIGSAILPLSYASPFFSTLPLKEHGLEWIFPDIPFSHPFPDGTALACYKDLKKTADQLGQDSEAYKKLFSSIVNKWDQIENDLLGPLHWPSHPLQLMKFGLRAFPSARSIVEHFFKEEKTKLLFYGAAAHSTIPLTSLASSSFGMVLTAMAHRYGWPFPKGGAGNFIKALISYYKSLGGKLFLDSPITGMKQMPEAKAYIFDLTPAQLLKIKDTDFSNLYRKRMGNYKYGAGVFKMDWALSEPIPFLNEKCRRSGTVHIGYTQKEMEDSESSIHSKKLSDTPYVLLAQHSNFDASRAPKGKYTAWAYAHVPNNNTKDISKEIENQIEKVAPGFRDCILKRSKLNTHQLETFDPNLVGGDINGGKQDITQLFTRPIVKLSPYSTPNPKIYICSSSTPPGGGVHGMGGYHASKRVLLDHFKDITG